MTPGRRSHEQPASDGGATAGSGERAAETAADASLFTFFQKKDSEFRALDRDELLTVEEVAQLLRVSRSVGSTNTRDRVARRDPSGCPTSSPGSTSASMHGRSAHFWSRSVASGDPVS